MTTVPNTFDAYLRDSIEAIQAMRNAKLQATLKDTESLLVKCLNEGGKLLVAGNGGSAADAQHFAAELIGRFKVNRAALPAIALTTDTSILTALANDFGYEQVFARQIEGLARPGDVFIGITTSGSSSNILTALASCHRMGVATVALTGRNGLTHGVVDELLAMPVTETALVQQCHEVCLHFLCSAVEAHFK